MQKPQQAQAQAQRAGNFNAATRQNFIPGPVFTFPSGQTNLTLTQGLSQTGYGAAINIFVNGSTTLDLELNVTKATWPGRWSRWGGRDGHGCVMGDREAESAGVILATDRRKERPLLSHCISRPDWADGADRRKTGELERELVRE